MWNGCFSSTTPLPLGKATNSGSREVKRGAVLKD